MIYITGDTHGNQKKWVEQIQNVLKSGDIIIIAGDFGIGFWNGPFWSEELFFDYIAKQNYTVLFVDGNHENFAKLNSYPIENWNGGKAHILRQQNLIHLMRGEIYSIDGVSIFTFGGGYSSDKYRRQENISWWPNELPSDDEYDNAIMNLKKANYCVDIIISHTAPFETVQYMSTMQKSGIKNDAIEERPLTTFLDYVQKNTEYNHWYFGHFHVDAELWRNQTALLSYIRELKTGKIVKRWNSYEV